MINTFPTNLMCKGKVIICHVLTNRASIYSSKVDWLTPRY